MTDRERAIADAKRHDYADRSAGLGAYFEQMADDGHVLILMSSPCEEVAAGPLPTTVASSDRLGPVAEPRHARPGDSRQSSLATTPAGPTTA
jgi:hypothetical protein